jgi:glycosyltransferase involved in cell wall biosynthesis
MQNGGKPTRSTAPRSWNLNQTTDINLIFYDLTELLYQSAGFKSYYGIARVVAEGAQAAAKSEHPVRFVAFSQAHDAFFEVFADHDETGAVEFDIPNAGQPIYTRRVNHGKRRLLTALSPLVFFGLDAWERRRWAQGAGTFVPLDLAGGRFLSAARPKLMANAVQHLERKGGVSLHFLLHDAMPLHDEAKRRKKRFNSSFHKDTSYLIERADQIIANSQFTAEDLSQFADQGVLPAPRRLDVAQLAHEFPAGSENPSLTLPKRDYVLMVGTALGRKNLDVVLAAMARIAETGATPPLLVLAGRERKRTVAYLERPEMAAVKPHVQMAPSPHQTDLERLYRGCMAVILPSELEGWGLPAAEALWLGRPAICSDIPVFHEVCGEAGIYFGLRDAAALAGYLTRLADDPAYRQACEQRVADHRPNLRSWSDFGRDLLDCVARAPL